jgi:hypothetical protein
LAICLAHMNGQRFLPFILHPRHDSQPHIGPCAG